MIISDFGYSFKDSNPHHEHAYLCPHSIGCVESKDGNVSHFRTQSPLRDYLFTCVTDGTFDFNQPDKDDCMKRCEKGTLVIFYPGEYFEVKTSVKNSKRIWLHISGNSLPEVMKDLNLWGKRIININERNLYDILVKFNKLKNVSMSEKNNNTVIVSCVLDFLSLFEQNTSSLNFTIYKQLQKSIAYINENFDKPINITELAAMCNVTESYYIRRFKQQFGKTPHQIILNRRFSSATHFLKHSTVPISEIAVLCGFNDRFHFSQAFKKYFNISPTDYRKIHQKR